MSSNMAPPDPRVHMLSLLSAVGLGRDATDSGAASGATSVSATSDPSSEHGYVFPQNNYAYSESGGQSRTEMEEHGQYDDEEEYGEEVEVDGVARARDVGQLHPAAVGRSYPLPLSSLQTYREDGYPLQPTAQMGSKRNSIRGRGSGKTSRGSARMHANFDSSNASLAAAVKTENSAAGMALDDYSADSDTATFVGEAAFANAGMKRRKKRSDASGQRRWACDQEGCTSTFDRKFDLERHSWIHKDERPFECESCRKRFIRQDYLAKHVCSKAGPAGAVSAPLAGKQARTPVLPPLPRPMSAAPKDGPAPTLPTNEATAGSPVPTAIPAPSPLLAPPAPALSRDGPKDSAYTSHATLFEMLPEAALVEPRVKPEPIVETHTSGPVSAAISPQDSMVSPTQPEHPQPMEIEVVEPEQVPPSASTSGSSNTSSLRLAPVVQQPGASPLHDFVDIYGPTSVSEEYIEWESAQHQLVGAGGASNSGDSLSPGHFRMSSKHSTPEPTTFITASPDTRAFVVKSFTDPVLSHASSTGVPPQQISSETAQLHARIAELDTLARTLQANYNHVYTLYMQKCSEATAWYKSSTFYQERSIRLQEQVSAYQSEQASTVASPNPTLAVPSRRTSTSKPGLIAKPSRNPSPSGGQASQVQNVQMPRPMAEIAPQRAPSRVEETRMA